MRLVRCAAIVFAFIATPATAQVYPDSRPVPQTTDPATLTRLATGRAIKERLHLAFVAESHSDWSGARAQLQAVLTMGPEPAERATAYYDLGLADAELQELAGAVDAFAEAVRIDPDFLAARANLVAVQLMRHDLEGARRTADAFVARAPDAARALYSRGLVALESGDLRTAISEFGALLARNPRYAVARYDLALAEIKQDRLADAERELLGALELSPAYARARFALGTVYLREGRRTEARDAFAQSARDTDDPTFRSLALSLRDSISS